MLEISDGYSEQQFTSNVIIEPFKFSQFSIQYFQENLKKIMWKQRIS